MGKINQGILGGVSGKVGTVIGSSWRGVEYIRSLPRVKKNAIPTEKQEQQRARFTLVFSFLQSMKDLLDIGFKKYAVKMSASNSALAFTLNNAVAGSFPNFAIAYDQVQVTRGSLPNATAPQAALGTGGNILFTWISNTLIGKAKAGDKCILVAYCEALNHTIYSMTSTRASATSVLNADMFAGHTVHTWISFQSEDGKEVATSVYTGELTINV